MKLIEPSYEILAATPDMERLIEMAGRVCWKSEGSATGPEATARLIEHLKNMNHMSVLEHGAITVRFVIDRGVSHELVRHRLASFSQESTRYCNYGKGKFNNECTFIRPLWLDESSAEELMVFCEALAGAERSYMELLSHGWKPQQAPAVLPNALKTEVVMTANPREWRHIIALRSDANPAAHPQIRQVITPLAEEFAKRWPLLFADLLTEKEEGT